MPRTQMLVGVDTNLSWGPQGVIQSVSLEVLRYGTRGTLRSFRSTALGPGRGQVALPLWVTVLAADDSDPSPLSIEALGCPGQGGCSRESAVVTQRASVHFVPGETRMIRLLLAGVCRARSCPSTARCEPTTGECVGIDAQSETRTYDGALPGRWANAVQLGGDAGVRPTVPNDAVDILFEIDNSNSMAANQANLARNFAALLNQLVSPPDRNMDGTADYPPVKSLHVGVISSDLGTPGSTVPSCANSDVGDDGLLNPIRNGQAIRSHQPWTTAPAGTRPARCTTDPNQYPAFLTFDAATTNPAEFRDDFVCNAYLSTNGCGLEQQLESAYRALVVHNPREQAGNRDPNAGFVRPNAVLAIVIVSDEEDGSTRDCRYAESGSGVGCTDGTGVFDSTSAAWASTDLNLRFYMYQPDSAQDPTWNLDRYMNPLVPNRGFTSLKPDRPENVIFAAIAGVPIMLPQTPSGQTDYEALLGRMPDGSDGYTNRSPEGPVSMRQRNMDPSCSTRVVPACRREGSSYDPMRPTCDTTVQYFAWPSRRIVEVARRFQATYNNGSVSSICRNDYTDALSQIARQIQRRLTSP